MGGGGGIGGSGCFVPPAPILAARADKDNDKDGRIIVKEMREKTRRGRRALIIAPRPRDSGRSACLLRRDIVGNGGRALVACGSEGNRPLHYGLIRHHNHPAISRATTTATKERDGHYYCPTQLFDGSVCTVLTHM